MGPSPAVMNETRKLVAEYRRLYMKTMTEGLLSIEEELPYSGITFFDAPLQTYCSYYDNKLAYRVFVLILRDQGKTSSMDAAHLGFIEALGHHFFLQSPQLSDTINDLGLYTHGRMRENGALAMMEGNIERFLKDVEQRYPRLFMNEN